MRTMEGIKEIQYRILLFSLLCISSFGLSAQEYEVVSFEVKQNDLTARTNPRVDANGRKCAIVKVYADDRIATVRGAVVGEVESVGMEKRFIWLMMLSKWNLYLKAITL